MLPKTIERNAHMKIVIVSPPKFITPFLKKIFKIKRNDTGA